MKICIDGLSISQLQGTGLYSYSYGLVSNLLEMYPQPKYELVWDGDTEAGLWKKYRNLSFVKLGINRRDNDYKPLEEHLANAGTDLFHSPNNGFSIPDKKVCKYVITVHDLSPVSCSKFVDEKYRQKFNALFPNALKQSDCIIAVSQFIKDELMKFYRVPERKIEVIHPWCSEAFKVIDAQAAGSVLKSRYNVEGKFLLYAGSLHLRKNLDALLKSFKMLLKQISDIRLVIVGNCNTKRKDYYMSLKSLIYSLGIEKHVIFTGTVAYEDMPYFYNCAACTVNLSSYDGFPATAVEASACGSPVVCLRSSSFEEVLGESALFLDSLDTGTIKNALLDTLYNETNRIPFKNAAAPGGNDGSRESSINKLVRLYETTVFGR